MIYLKFLTATLMISIVLSSRQTTRLSKRMNVVASAIAEIVNHLGDKKSMKFGIVIVGNSKELDQLAIKVVKKVVIGTHSIKIEQKESYEKISSMSSSESKIYLSAKELTIDVNATLDGEVHEFYPYYDSVMIFYYLQQDNVTVYSKTFNEFHRFTKPRLLFIAHSTNKNSNSLKLHGFVKYATCNYTFDLSLRNTFIASRMKWTHQMFQHEYKNFNGCPIFVIAPVDVLCTLSHIISSTGELINIGSVHGDLIHMYAEMHNAILKIDTQADMETGRKLEISLQHTTRFSEWVKYVFTPTVPIDDHRIAFLVSRGREFTPFEKLVLPFDSMTWYLNIATFLASYLVVSIIYQMPEYMQKFVFGSNNRSPSMSIAQIFFGIGLIQMPGRNFARFIFMMFTIFCLIIRTAYQGKMYDFLQYDVRQPTLKTGDEVLQNKVPLTRFGVFLTDELEQQLGFAKTPQIGDELEIFFHGTGQTLEAFIMDRHLLACIKMMNGDPAENRLIDENTRITDDDFISGLNTWYVTRFSVVHNSLNKFLLECHQHGIINYLNIKYKGKPPKISEKETTKVLTMYMLSAGFYIWLTSVGVACAVFVFEFSFEYVTSRFD